MSSTQKTDTSINMDQFLLYTTPSGKVKVEIFFHDDNIWLTQKRMTVLFGVTTSTINEHLKNIFNSDELDENSVIRNFRITAADNKQYLTKFYNLDAIISVGYRVNSRQATQFRIWATQQLREFMLKGFIIDDDRLKNGKHFGKDYFQELLERVRSIRASERRIYQKITDIFAECSIDYDPRSKTTQTFFAQIQNKFHYAITGKTAAEIIYSTADRTQPKMGLKSYKHSPKGRVLKSDTTIAKNYLPESDIKKLERTISSYFDYIENQIEQQRSFSMEEFALSVNRFLEFNNFRVLDGRGGISRNQAETKAFTEYKEFNKHQVIESDFDQMIQQLKES